MSTPPRTQAPGRRRRAVLVALALVPIGLAARLLPGLVGDLAGGVAYAGLVYALVVAAAPRWARTATTAVAGAVVVGIELLQLSGVPAELARAVPPLRYVLGSTFAPLDLVSAVAGVALAALVDLAATRTRRGRA